MHEEFQFDVFLSHSSKDKAVVRPLAERLRADGSVAASRQSAAFLSERLAREGGEGGGVLPLAFAQDDNLLLKRPQSESPITAP
jgi:hypothetical protein